MPHSGSSKAVAWRAASWLPHSGPARCTMLLLTPASGAGMLLLEAEQWSETERLLHATVRDKKNDPYGWMALGVMNLRRWQLEPKVALLHLHCCCGGA